MQELSKIIEERVLEHARENNPNTRTLLSNELRCGEEKLKYLTPTRLAQKHGKLYKIKSLIRSKYILVL